MITQANRGNLPLGIIGGAIAAILGAVLWAAITAATSFQIGYMAIGVGFIVAFAMRTLGQGHDSRFAYASGALSLLGCVLGNFLAACVVVANHIHADMIATIITGFAHVPEVMQDSFSVMDLFFYAIGAYFGYKYALAPPRPVPEAPQG